MVHRDHATPGPHRFEYELENPATGLFAAVAVKVDERLDGPVATAEPTKGVLPHAGGEPGELPIDPRLPLPSGPFRPGFRGTAPTGRRDGIDPKNRLPVDRLHIGNRPAEELGLLLRLRSREASPAPTITSF
jgi:hypothetical protein